MVPDDELDQIEQPPDSEPEEDNEDVDLKPSNVKSKPRSKSAQIITDPRFQMKHSMADDEDEGGQEEEDDEEGEEEEEEEEGLEAKEKIDSLEDQNDDDEEEEGEEKEEAVEEEEGEDDNESGDSDDEEDIDLGEKIEEFNAVQENRGVVYLSFIPPRMRPAKIKKMLNDFGTVTRVYLVPEGKLTILICHFNGSPFEKLAHCQSIRHFLSLFYSPYFVLGSERDYPKKLTFFFQL